MNGTLLTVLGAIWGNVELPSRVNTAARWTALYGTYGNWLFTTLGASFGTAAANPIASAGHTGEPWREKLVGAGFLSIAVSIIASAVLTLVGLIRKPSAYEKSS